MTFVTCGSVEEAEKIATGLVNNRLAACVNIAEVQSIFRWQGKLENESERLLIIKSLKSRFEEMDRFIRANHSYDCPEIIAFDITRASGQYASWVQSACTGQSTDRDKKDQQ